jgi:hypothetical protein
VMRSDSFCGSSGRPRQLSRQGIPSDRFGPDGKWRPRPDPVRLNRARPLHHLTEGSATGLKLEALGTTAKPQSGRF